MNYEDRCEEFPGPDRGMDKPGADIINAVALDMAETADCAVIMRILLGRYGWSIATAALSQAVQGDISGAAVQVVYEKMKDLLEP